MHSWKEFHDYIKDRRDTRRRLSEGNRNFW
jgi:hypothetical protein